MSSNVFKCGKFKIVLIVFLLTSAGMAQTVPLMTENFENGGALPSGWVTEVLNPGNTLSFLTSSTWPSGYGAYSGAYMVCFNSFTAAGGIIRMKNTIPVSTVGYSSISVDFAWLESKNYAGVTDHVEVEWSTDATTWTSAATFQRWNAVQGWKIKSVNLPASALGRATLYIAFKFTSAYGNDCYLDLVHVTGTPPVPGMINYQGRVVVNGTNFDGTGQFQFALVNEGGGTVYWSNGVSSVSLPVVKGLYSVLLGDMNVPNMAYSISSTVFTNTDVYLRVSFNGGSGMQIFSPDQRIASVGYAMSANAAFSASSVPASGVSGILDNSHLDPNLQTLAANNAIGLTNLTLSGAVGAGLTDSNTFFISSSAAAGGNGSMAKPWNSLYPLNNNSGYRLNGKTVIVLAGTYLMGTDVVFDATYTNLTVKGWDSQNVQIVSTNNNCRAFTCNTGSINIVLEGMTVTSTNNGGHGGAIYLQPGCTVQNCSISSCADSGYAGGVICYNGGTVQNCTFSGCSAPAGLGGGVYCYNGGEVKNCSFSGCSAGGGGGVFCYNGGTAQNCTFSGCSTSGNGGGAGCSTGGMIQNCSFNGCTAVNYGGGVGCAGGEVRNCSFSGCSASLGGGGVFGRDGCTIQSCSSIRGSGNTNSVYTFGSVTWMSVWTNNTSAAGFVTWSTNLNN